MTPSKFSKYFPYTAFFLILILCVVLYKDIFFLYPSYIHAWAQTDRYALALCFIDNGFDFFHPCTFNYNLGCPPLTPLVDEAGITSVDFPLNEYIIALIMKLSGSTSPFIFRLYILCFSLTGLFFLFKLSNILTKSNIASFVICLFVFLSPVFNYYQVTFIPSIPAISCLFIAYYFYVKYLYSDQFYSFTIAIVFFTLSALFRFPFIIFLLAMIAFYSLEWIQHKKIEWKKVISFTLSLFVIGSYFIYNLYLRNKYGSTFLGHALPAQNWDAFVYLIVTAYNNWSMHYFTYYQYVFILLVVITFLAAKGYSGFNIVLKKLLRILLITLAGSVMYSILMIQQFPDHDYYFLDTYFPVIILLLVILIGCIYNNITNTTIKNGLMICSLFLLFLSFLDLKKINIDRYAEGQWNKAELNDRLSYEHSDVFLDVAGIPRSAKMLVIGSNTSNMPFILMKRKGYSIINTHPDTIKKSFEKKFDYIVMKNDEMYNEIIIHDSSIVKQLLKMADNGRISVYKKSLNTHTDVKTFIGFSDENIYKRFVQNFEENVNAERIKNTGVPSDSCVTRPHGGCIRDEYGLTVEFVPSDFPKQQDALQLVYAEIDLFEKEENQNLKLVVNAVDLLTAKSIYYRAFPLTSYIKKNSWGKASFAFAVPPIDVNTELKIYIYNPDKKDFYYDNFKLYIKK